MKENYNIKINPQELSSEQISKHQNFDALFAQFQDSAETTSNDSGLKEPVDNIRKIPAWVVKYGTGAFIAVAASLLLVFMLKQMVASVEGIVPTDQIDELLALQAPLSDFQKSFGNLTVQNAEQGETLEYHSGSRIIVPASAFVDEKGLPVRGKVDIQYREFNDHVDMFLAGVPKELDKHQNLQSVAMMEIKGYQNGNPVFLSTDKTLDVELRGKVISNFPTNELDVFVYSKKQDAWDYNADDIVEVIAKDQVFMDSSSLGSDAEILAKAEASLKSSKPVEPIKVGVPENMQVFDFDIKIADFPALAKYNENVQFIVDKSQVNDQTFDPEWNSMDMKENGNNKFILLLSRDENGEKIVEKFDVYPAVIATELSENQYRIDIEKYNTKFKQWNADVQAAVNQIKMDFDNNLNSGWAQIINKFSIHRFGLWNCGQKVEMKDELQIDANFVNANGDDLAIDKLFISNKNKQLYYFTPFILNSESTPIKYHPNDNNLIWAITDNNQLLVANTADVPADDKQFTFQMKPAAFVKSEEDVRNVLTF
jgi:hypothetical protein